MESFQHNAMEMLGLYVQIPFCASKCTFCNFSSQVAPSTAYEAYVNALDHEISLLPCLSVTSGTHSALSRRSLDTLYFGGGTPTLLGAARIGRICAAIRQTFDASAISEATIEMTPGSADAALLERLAATGFNRASIGAQSFEDRELRATGRLHSAADIVNQVRMARAAGFANVSIDLIAGLPHQTPESWRKNLQTAAQLRPEHVSVYLFETDEKSRLGREILKEAGGAHASSMPGEDFMARAYESACEFFTTEGYEHYEISNFALPGKRSIHNQKYWRREPYLGVGAGAHSFDGSKRWSNEISPAGYQARIEQGELAIVESTTISPAEEMEEFFFLGLRTREGIDLNQARLRWGEPPFSAWEQAAQRLEHGGYLLRSENRLRLTEKALLVSNEIFQEFLV